MRKQKARQQKDSKIQRSGRSKKKQLRPRSIEEYFATSERFQDRWNRVAHVISKMRSGHVSLRKAAREFGIDPGLVTRLGRSGLRKQKNGRYAARKTDRLLRVLSVLTNEGKREIALRDSRQASLLGSYWDAVQRYLQTGDDSALNRFEQKRITDASRKLHPLLTDRNELNRLGSAGVLSFESLYGRSV
jgi:hypothetical protein